MNLEKMYNELLEVSKNLDVLEEMLIEKDAKIAELEKQLAMITDAAKKVTGWDIPTAYDNENDDTGHCPYCSGWNMQHRKDCKIYALGKLVENTPEFTPPSEVSDEL